MINACSDYNYWLNSHFCGQWRISSEQDKHEVTIKYNECVRNGQGEKKFF